MAFLVEFLLPLFANKYFIKILLIISTFIVLLLNKRLKSHQYYEIFNQYYIKVSDRHTIEMNGERILVGNKAYVVGIMLYQMDKIVPICDFLLNNVETIAGKNAVITDRESVRINGRYGIKGIVVGNENDLRYFYLLQEGQKIFCFMIVSNKELKGRQDAEVEKIISSFCDHHQYRYAMEKLNSRERVGYYKDDEGHRTYNASELDRKKIDLYTKIFGFDLLITVLFVVSFMLIPVLLEDWYYEHILSTIGVSGEFRIIAPTYIRILKTFGMALAGYMFFRFSEKIFLSKSYKSFVGHNFIRKRYLIRRNIFISIFELIFVILIIIASYDTFAGVGQNSVVINPLTTVFDYRRYDVVDISSVALSVTETDVSDETRIRVDISIKVGDDIIEETVWNDLEKDATQSEKNQRIVNLIDYYRYPLVEVEPKIIVVVSNMEDFSLNQYLK